ncbi:hypothetical protein JTP77_017900, partial [Streptomyces sp. S9]|nr:hypothetical protein [Streptomyces sp. S9]
RDAAAALGALQSGTAAARAGAAELPGAFTAGADGTGPTDHTDDRTDDDRTDDRTEGGAAR